MICVRTNSCACFAASFIIHYLLFRQLRSDEPLFPGGEKENAVLMADEDDQRAEEEFAAFAAKRNALSQLRGFPGDEMILRHNEKY